MNHRSSRSPRDTARVLLFSMRNMAHHVSRCGGYEFEDVICGCENADVIAPSLSRAEGASRIGRYLNVIFDVMGKRIDGEIRVAKEYELFFAFLMEPGDLRRVELLEGLHDKCRRSVCVIGELWPSMIRKSRRHLEVLRNFDCVFSSLESSVRAIQEISGRPCHFLPFGVNALLFCPYPQNPARNIDVYNMGRRHQEIHQVLMARADRGEIFYVYDTVGDFPVLDAREHRSLLANVVKRSRYFIAYPPKFDRPDETGGLEEIGSRFFEGAAGGAVMLGMPPRCAAFESCFARPDAVIPTPANGQIAALIADLESDPRRVGQIRRDNVVNSLQRHDWVYRWREILDRIGLPLSAGIVDREKRLETTARAVAAGDNAAHPPSGATNTEKLAV